MDLLLMLFDLWAVSFAFLFALWFRFDCHFSEIPTYFFQAWLNFTTIYGVISIAIFWLFRLYQSIWRFAGHVFCKDQHFWRFARSDACGGGYRCSLRGFKGCRGMRYNFGIFLHLARWCIASDLHRFLIFMCISFVYSNGLRLAEKAFFVFRSCASCLSCEGTLELCADIAFSGEL